MKAPLSFARWAAFSLLLLFAAWTRPVQGQAEPSRPALPHRYLFLIDTSLESARSSLVVRQTVYDLLVTSMFGQMRPGDVLDIWTYDDDVHTDRFPEVTWDPAAAESWANRGDELLRQEPVNKRGDFKNVMAATLRAFSSSPSITLFLLNDGSEPLKGTPFDRKLNAIYRANGARLRRTKKPFVTIMVAVSGQLVNYRITEGGSSIEIPSVPGRLSSEVTAAFTTPSGGPTNRPADLPPSGNMPAASVTSAPPTLATNTITLIEPKSPASRSEVDRPLVVVPNPVTATNPESPATEGTVRARPANLNAGDVKPAADNQPPNPVPAERNEVKKEEPPPDKPPEEKPAAPPTVETNRPPLLEKPTNAVLASAPGRLSVTNLLPPTNAAVVSPRSPAATLAASQTLVAANAPQPNRVTGSVAATPSMPPPRPLAATPSPPPAASGAGHGLLLGAAVGFLLAALFLVFWLGRRTAAQSRGSLISRSFEEDKR